MALPSCPARSRVVLLLSLLAAALLRAQSPAVPLLLPAGLVYDAGGNLYFAETRNHVVRKLSVGGVLSIVAGMGVQGFTGDGGPATAALLDSPTGVALDGAGDLFIADTHNHRIRRVDAATGTISTFCVAGLPVALAVDASGAIVFADAARHQVFLVASAGAPATVVAGSGVQGFAGDGGPAAAALLDTPSGLAFDAQGDLYLADTHNQRVRRVDAATGLISTVAGTGSPGFSGDGSSASGAKLSLPRGLAVDSTGNLYLVDARNERLRRIDAVTGAITTLGGVGSEGFSGDGAAATQAQLDLPRSVGLTPDGLATLADSGNHRVRQIAADGTIQTIAGAGAVTPAKLATATALTQPSAGMLQCAVTAAKGTPTGLVTLVDAVTPIASAALAGGVAAFSTTPLSAGSHTVTCSYTGAASYQASVSPPLVVTIGPPPAPGFTLAANGASAVTTTSGGMANYSFVVTPTGSPLSGEIALALAGLPTGAHAAFTPAFLPPPSGPLGFGLAVTAPVVGAGIPPVWPLAALLLPLLLLGRRRRLLVLGVLALTGCGDRVNHSASGTGGTPVSYNLTVNATTTLPSGAILQQSVPITLTVQ